MTVSHDCTKCSGLVLRIAGNQIKTQFLANERIATRCVEKLQLDVAGIVEVQSTAKIANDWIDKLGSQSLTSRQLILYGTGSHGTPIPIILFVSAGGARKLAGSPLAFRGSYVLYVHRLPRSTFKKIDHYIYINIRRFITY
jgi:hypothetical protein